MKTDRQGCSTCRPGQELYETYRSQTGKVLVQYEFRDVDGELFTTIAPTLEEAQACCRRHLQEKETRR